MAGLGRKVFTPGEVLTATNVQNYLMDQAVQVYASEAARGSAIGSATTEGMVSWLSDVNEMQVATGTASWVDVYPPVVTSGLLPAGSILQVVSDTLTTATSASPSAFAWADVTGLSLSITPTKTSSKIFVTYNLPVSGSIGCFVGARIVRNSTAIGVNTSSSTLLASSVTFITDSTRLETLSGSFLDSPSTTSATTYKMQFAQNTTATLYANRRASATDLGGAATITAFEVAG
jgi:hypothetical protein